MVRLLTRERAMLSKEKELATSLKSNTLKQGRLMDLVSYQEEVCAVLTPRNLLSVSLRL